MLFARSDGGVPFSEDMLEPEDLLDPCDDPSDDPSDDGLCKVGA